MVSLSYFQYHAIYAEYGLAVYIQVPGHSGTGVFTHICDKIFREFFYAELRKVVDRFVQHVWPKALHLVTSPLDFQGQLFHILSGSTPINASQLEVWTKNFGKVGYGVFHHMVWDQNSETYVVGVSILLY